MGDVERWIAEERKRNTSYREIRSTLRSKGYTSREVARPNTLVTAVADMTDSLSVEGLCGSRPAHSSLTSGVGFGSSKPSR